MKIESRYLDGSYLNENPEWDRKDALWKANLVGKIVKDHSLNPASVCDIGCGSGDMLIHLINNFFPLAQGFGFDVSPDLEKFWADHIDQGEEKNLPKFIKGNFHEVSNRTYDLLCMLDVFEHVRDPFTFLEETLRFSKYFVFHIPLDLSAISVFRGKPLLYTRKKVGHLHYYTKDLALETLRDCGYRIIEWRYTGAFLKSPNRSLVTKITSIPRKISFALSKEYGVRLLGGETLIVLAEVSK